MTTEKHNVVFKDLIAGQSVSVGGLTLTATDSLSATQIAAGFANLNAGAIVGNTVVLTKTVPGTPWLTGTQVRYLSGLQNRNDNDGATEDLIINAALYETWNKEVIGRGMPVLGSLSGGKWFPDWSVTVSG